MAPLKGLDRIGGADAPAAAGNWVARRGAGASATPGPVHALSRSARHPPVTRGRWLKAGAVAG